MALRSLCLVLLLAAGSGAMNALGQPAPDAPPVNAAAMLEELKQLKARQQTAKRQQLQAATADLVAAGRTNDAAARIYADSLRETEFAGNTQKFLEWRDRHKDLLGSNKAFGTAARLHLQYLTLSLNRAANPEGPAPLKETWDYVVQLAGARQQFGRDLTASEPARVMLDRSIAESPVVKARLLKPELEKLRNWEMAAGSLDGILEKNLRGPLRKARDPRLLDTWTLQIDFRGKLVAKADGEVESATYEQVELPRLLWSRAKDMAVLGQKNRAAGEMFALVRKYPAHPDFPTWVDELSAALEPGTPAAAEAPAAGN